MDTGRWRCFIANKDANNYMRVNDSRPKREVLGNDVADHI